MNETMNTILSRRSIRAYKPEQITDEELNAILEAGRFAPSAVNQQSWHLTVVQNKEVLHRINEAAKAMLVRSGNKIFAERAKSESFSIFYNAPTLIIISGDNNAFVPQLDCALAMENIFLAAASLNIGSCWINAVINLLNSEEGRELGKELGIPEGYSTFCAGSFGYKAVEGTAAPRKESTVNIIR